CLSVLGPNGAGKTTTIEILEGLKTPDGGQVEVLGRSWSENRREIQERIGVQLQETEFQDKLTVFELLRMFRSFYRQGSDIEEVVRTIGLLEKRRARVKTLSGGQKQRLAVGCALLSRPEILFLDEPLAGLDISGEETLYQLVDELRRTSPPLTVLMVSHDLQVVYRRASRVFCLNRSLICSGSPTEVLTDENLRRAYGAMVGFYEHDHPHSEEAVDG
ncbi:MAG: metal ABC transporter ATP-binding protein, partial [Nitrospinae bacterium]|nr:metal ABC transporter ATP-binding protein [Nitrospinota bacterium]